MKKTQLFFQGLEPFARCKVVLISASHNSIAALALRKTAAISLAVIISTSRLITPDLMIANWLLTDTLHTANGKKFFLATGVLANYCIIFQLKNGIVKYVSHVFGLNWLLMGLNFGKDDSPAVVVI